MDSSNVFRILKKSVQILKQGNRIQQTSLSVQPSVELDETQRRSWFCSIGRENMTSFTKPEIHNLLHCRPRRIEPWPQLTYTEKFVKFRRAVFEIYERTDQQTDIQADRNTLHLYRRRSIIIGSKNLSWRYLLYGGKRTAFTRSDITRRKWTDLDEIWNSVRQMLGAGPDRF